MPQAPDLPTDLEALKHLVIEGIATLALKDAALTQAAAALAAQEALLEATEAKVLAQKLELEKLRFEIAYLKRQKYGRSSEQMDVQLVQMQLSIEDLEASLASKIPDSRATSKEPAQKPARRSLPPDLLREERVLENPCSCPDCGGELRALGEDISEILERVPARYKVIRIVRPKLSCANCQKIVQPLAPSRPIERGLAGPGMLAHLLVSKYCDHLPLYRQSRILARDQIDLDRSTLADWVGGCSRLLQPLVDAIGRYVLAAAKDPRGRHAGPRAVSRPRHDKAGSVMDLRAR